MLSPNLLPMLITGLPGVPGYNAFYYFRKLYGQNIIGIRRRDLESFTGESIYGINGEKYSLLEGLFKKYHFRSVVDASGCCALRSCEYNSLLAAKVNVLYGKNLAILSKIDNIRLIRLSTDLVFDGMGLGGYNEDSPVSPVTVYGRTMARAEDEILNANPKAVVLRITLPMGPSYNGHAGAMDWIQGRFKKGLPATLYYDEVRSNIYIQDLLGVLELFLEEDWQGVFHLGGPRALSLFQIAQIINREGGYTPALLKGCYRQEAGPIPPRAGNVSLNSDKINALLPAGFIKPWPLNQDLIPTNQLWHCDREQPGSSDALAERLHGYEAIKNPRHPANYSPSFGETVK